MPEREPILSRELRTLLRAPVDLGPGARARVMQRVRAAAALPMLESRPRGAVRPAILGALLAACLVASFVTASARDASGGAGHRSLADTLAVQFAAAADEARPSIDRDRIVAVADATRDLAPKVHPAAEARRNLMAGQ